ncbi:MAG: universal stress protein [Cytophagales bacterium]|nr:universal stress protein [Rhizobacter sp.]
MKILLAVDDSPFSKHMLAYLAAHAEWFNPANDYTVLHCITPLPNGLAPLLDAAQTRAREEAEAQAVFAPLRVFLERHQIKPSFVHEVGHPASAITGLAQRGGFDLVMVGSRGHGALGSLVLGSTATKVLALSKVPVLIIRHDERHASARV